MSSSKVDTEIHTESLHQLSEAKVDHGVVESSSGPDKQTENAHEEISREHTLHGRLVQEIDNGFNFQSVDKTGLTGPLKRSRNLSAGFEESVRTPKRLHAATAHSRSKRDPFNTPSKLSAYNARNLDLHPSRTSGIAKKLNFKSSDASKSASPAPQTKPADYPIDDPKARHAEWQRQYRKAFPLFHFFFDHVDDNTTKKISRQITSLGGHIETFFSSSVTHLITTRDIPDFSKSNVLQGSVGHTNHPVTNENPRSLPLARSRHLSAQGLGLPEDWKGKNDVLQKAHNLKMKIWNLDKLVNKVLGNLVAGVAAEKRPLAQPDLSHLLNDEKVHGTRERDPKATRSDFVNFKGPYILVRDIQGQFKPIMYRDFPKTFAANKEPWPTFRQTSAGRCPFVPDRHREKQLADRAKLDRVSASQPVVTSLPTRDDKENRIETNDAALAQKQKHDQISKPALKVLQDSTNRRMKLEVAAHAASVRHETISRSNSQIMSAGNSALNQADINASGIVQSTLTSAIRSNAPTSRSTNITSGSFATSNNSRLLSNGLNMMQQRVVQQKSSLRGAKHSESLLRDNVSAERRSKSKASHSINQSKANAKPGFCENCREKFENFEMHCRSRSHRKFAEEESNFAELDELLCQLTRPLKSSQSISMGLYDFEDSEAF